eukprot:g3010.t1
MSGGPDLKKYMGKLLAVKMNANRTVKGELQGYDQFMNLVLENAVEVVKGGGQDVPIGTVVIRGNSVIRLEALQRPAAA